MSQWHENLVEGNQPHVYKFAVRLARDYYIDLTSIKTLTKPKRGFTIWKWATGIKGTKNDYHTRWKNAPVICSGWRKMISYEKGKWKREEEDNTYHNFGSPMMSAHLFFKTSEEFREWLGEDEFLKMFGDIL